jgi:hypothetical protein
MSGRLPVARVVSAALAMGCAVAVAAEPWAMGLNGVWWARFFGAAMLLGVFGAALHGIGWQSERAHLRALARPVVAWTAIVFGAGGGFVLQPLLGVA